MKHSSIYTRISYHPRPKTNKGLSLGRMSPENEAMLIRLMGTASDSENPTTSTTVVPHALFARPVTSTLAASSSVVGYLVGILSMDAYLANLLPSGIKNLSVVAKTSCGDEHTFLLEEERVSPFFLKVPRLCQVSSSCRPSHPSLP